LFIRISTEHDASVSSEPHSGTQGPCRIVVERNVGGGICVAQHRFPALIFEFARIVLLPIAFGRLFDSRISR
jgi:hypothetical protein